MQDLHAWLAHRAHLRQGAAPQPVVGNSGSPEFLDLLWLPGTSVDERVVVKIHTHKQQNNALSLSFPLLRVQVHTVDA